MAARRNLSPRQAEILGLVAEGLGDKEIALRLGVSTNTVRTHLQRLYRERGIRNRAEAAAVWVVRQSEALAPAAAASSSPGPSSQPVAPLRPFRSGFAILAAAISLLLAAVLVAAAYRPALNLAGAPAALKGEPSATSTPGAAPSGGVEATSQPAPSGTAASTPTASTSSNPTPVAALRTPVGSSAPSADPTKPLAIGAAPATTMLALLNADRAGAGLPPLTWNGCLANVAVSSTQQLASVGSLPAGLGNAGDLVCHAGLTSAEIDAFWSAPDAGQLNTVLMSTPADRKAILGQYHAVGAAWASAPNGVTYLVLELA